MSTTYATPTYTTDWKPDPALVCPDCQWAPPPYYRYGVRARQNKAMWATLYAEHRRDTLCPQSRRM